MDDALLGILPLSLQSIIGRLDEKVKRYLEEIRIRENRPLEIIFHRTYRFVDSSGNLCLQEDAYRPTREDCLKMLELLTNFSLYSFEEQLREGYITVTGGHRVGLAGRVVVENGKIRFIKDISSFNIRIAKEVVGAGAHILPNIVDFQKHEVHHTLVISPPQQGKTTLIRDLTRMLSYGLYEISAITNTSHRGFKVGVVDERSEIAACVRGIPRFDLGPRTDVLDGCPKAAGMMMMIRSMSPEVIVVDEVGRPEDAIAIREALHAGVSVIATAHGTGLGDIMRRPLFRELMEDSIFTRYIVLGNKQGNGTLEAIYDHRGEPIKQPVANTRSRNHL